MHNGPSASCGSLGSGEHSSDWSEMRVDFRVRTWTSMLGRRFHTYRRPLVLENVETDGALRVSGIQDAYRATLTLAEEMFGSEQ